MTDQNDQNGHNDQNLLRCSLVVNTRRQVLLVGIRESAYLTQVTK